MISVIRTEEDFENEENLANVEVAVAPSAPQSETPNDTIADTKTRSDTQVSSTELVKTTANTMRSTISVDAKPGSAPEEETKKPESPIGLEAQT